MNRRNGLLLIACSLAAFGCGNFRDRSVLSSGNWVVEKVELEGKDVTDESFEIVFGGMNDSISITVGDTIHKGLYEVDSGKDPKEIDIKPDASNRSDKPLKGIYAIDSDGRGLTLCFSPKKRPKRFETTPGSDAVLIILRRSDAPPRVFGPNGQPKGEDADVAPPPNPRRKDRF